MALLHYGRNSSLAWDSNGEAPLERGHPRRQPTDDIRAAVAAALGDPLDYPPLVKAITPGDRVVIALDHAMPKTAEITAAVLEQLDQAGLDPDGVTVLKPQAMADDPCRLLPSRLRERVRLVTHDPSDRRSLAYLASTAGGEPIYLHRALNEADLVVPIGCICRETAAGYYGIHSSIYPGLADDPAQTRFRSLASIEPSGKRHEQLEVEANEVAWLLGVNFTTQIVPGPGDSVLDIVAGQPEAVHRRGLERYHEAWSATLPARAGLVVAAIEGGPEQQTWENLGRALGAAMDLVEDGGAIAVCCELAAHPGPAVQSMVAARNLHSVMKRIGKHLPVDALPAAQLARALESGRVYLLSQLDPALCEQLDIVPVSPDELMRLVRRHPSCVLLANAPSAIVRVEDEWAES